MAASNDGGRSFTPPAGPSLAYLSWGPAATGTTLLAATAEGVYRSDDNGTTFRPIT